MVKLLFYFSSFEMNKANHFLVSTPHIRTVGHPKSIVPPCNNCYASNNSVGINSTVYISSTYRLVSLLSDAVITKFFPFSK